MAITRSGVNRMMMMMKKKKIPHKMMEEVHKNIPKNVIKDK